jgi:pyridoxamine 5'-phosphate oxidase
VSVAFARTRAAFHDDPQICEVQELYLDMIARAKQTIYIENQYFTSNALGEALAARLAEEEGPEVIAVLRLSTQGWLEAPTMGTLRTVLLKSYDGDGFVFFTNRGSCKAREMEQNGRVSLLFPWIAQERQVIVIGTAQQISKVQTLRYFLTRPRGSQIAAWISPQSSVIASRKFLDMQWEAVKQKFADGKVPVPPFWGGYRVRPREIEFWQGRANRLHDRFCYLRREDGTWTIDRLAP